MKWIKNLLSNKPKGLYEGFTTREKLSFLYVFFSINACILVGYASRQGKFDLAEYHGLKTDEDKLVPSGVSLARSLKMDNAVVVRYTGFKEIERIKLVDGAPTTVKKDETSDE